MQKEAFLSRKWKMDVLAQFSGPSTNLKSTNRQSPKRKKSRHKITQAETGWAVDLNSKPWRRCSHTLTQSPYNSSLESNPSCMPCHFRSPHTVPAHMRWRMVPQKEKMTGNWVERFSGIFTFTNLQTSCCLRQARIYLSMASILLCAKLFAHEDCKVWKYLSSTATWTRLITEGVTEHAAKPIVTYYIFCMVS